MPFADGASARTAGFLTTLLERAGRAHAMLTLSEWAQTNSYRNYVRSKASAYALSLGEVDAQNLVTYYDEVNRYVVEQTTPYAEQLLATHFVGVRRPVGSVRGRMLHNEITGVTAWNLYLPWLRTGEIAAEPTVTMTAAHP